MDLSIIIVNWNSQKYLRGCLTSFYKYCSKTASEVIVVDNASHDGCGVMLQQEFPEVIFVQSEKNLGFSGANNLGVARAAAPVVLFLNPDTEFVEDSITILLDRLRELPRAAIVGCKLLGSTRELQTSCIQSFPSILNQLLDSDYLRARFPRSKLWGTAPFLAKTPVPAAVEVISGACLMMRREVFQQVGGFTESYFMYGEDLDLCFKTIKAGYQVYYVPETSVIHFGGASTKKAPSNFSSIMMRASVAHFLRINRGIASSALYRGTMAVNALVRLGMILLLLPTRSTRIVRHGRDSIRKWTAVLRWSLGLENPLKKLHR